MNQRHRRAVAALLSGPKFREELDRIVGCSNFPEIAAKLRRHLFGQHLQCERVERIDRHGKRTYPGRYFLSKVGRTTAMVGVLREQGVIG